MNSLPPDIGNYTFCGFLGKGQFSEVYKVINKQDGKYYACKVVDFIARERAHSKLDIQKEIDIMKSIESPYVVRFIDYFQDSKNGYLIMELCEGGTLLKLIIKGHGLTNDLSKKLFFQILLGISNMHSHNIAHLDIKPDNIYLDDKMNVKIGDFDISTKFDDKKLTKSTSGTKYYISPECISGNEYNPFISDMWSLGITLYSMTTGRLPWRTKEKQEVFAQIRAGDFSIPLTVIPEIKDVIQGLLQMNPEDRWNIDDCLNSRWLYKMEEEKFFPKFKSNICLINEDEIDEIDKTSMKSNRSTSQYNFTSQRRMSFDYRSYMMNSSKNGNSGMKSSVVTNTRNPFKLVVPRINQNKTHEGPPATLRKNPL